MAAPGILTYEHDLEVIEATSRALFLDFEQELEEILGPSRARQSYRRSSTISSSSSSSPPIDEVNRRGEPNYDSDGTLPCSEVSYDTLCYISATSLLTHLKTLTLCVKSRSSFDNLALLAMHTPNLTTLLLDHSKIHSLRVLGDELPNLKTLSVSNCGLQSLDGIAYVPNLLTFVGADNHIDEILPITELRKIITIDLENNLVNDFNSVSFLFLCSKLENLVFRGNPISEDPDYRSTIFHYLPNLKTLDSHVTSRPSKEFCRRNRNISKEDNDDHPPDGRSVNQVVEINDEDAKIEDEETLCPKGDIRKAVKTDKLLHSLVQETQTYEHEKEPFENKNEDHNVQRESGAKELANLESPNPVEIPAQTRRRNSKLLDRRKSQDPIFIRDFRVETSEESAPNLARLSSSLTLRESALVRPDSVASLTSSSAGEASELAQITEDDSGIDSSKASSSSKRVSKTPKLVVDEESEHQRKARTNKYIAMARETSSLTGITTQEGDIEIEDFEMEND